MANINLANWVKQQCCTTGTGLDIVLSDIPPGYTSFANAVPAGKVPYSIIDGFNRESGIGDFDGIDVLHRLDIESTLINGVYNSTNPLPIDLSGNSTVGLVISKEAWDYKEDYLNNPTVDGHVLTSTIAGVRSWKAGGTGTLPPNPVTEFNIDGGSSDSVYTLEQLVDGGGA